MALGQGHIAPFAGSGRNETNPQKPLGPKLQELWLGGLYVSEDVGGLRIGPVGTRRGVRGAQHGPARRVGRPKSIHNMCAQNAGQLCQ